MFLFDLHTHQLEPKSPAIVSLPPEIIMKENSLIPRSNIGYAVGIHPWLTKEKSLTEINSLWNSVTHLATHPAVCMIGETGLDALRGDLEIQLSLLERHIALSEELQKPLLLHSVRTSHLLLSLRKHCRPQQTWIVHGFRGKAIQATQLLTAGIDLSFGFGAQAESLQICPIERLHIETDDGMMTIEKVFHHLCTLYPALESKDFSLEREKFLPKFLVE